MRAATETRRLAVDPGSTGSVVVDVVNTGAVIDGVTANVIGLADECVQTQPSLLPLFPASSGQLTVSLAIPLTHPAGRHPITVELVSHGAHLPSQYLDVDLDVSARPGMAMTPVPRIVRARRSGRFVLEIANNGNVPLNVELKAVDVERSTKATFTPAQVRVEPGAVVPVLLHVRGPRMFTGGEADRAVQLSATAQRADLAPRAADAEPGDEAVPFEPLKPLTTGVQLRQRPLISRGMFTALILMSIVALWAAVFLFGLTKVFSNDPMTKAAPASFYMSAKSAKSIASGASGAQAAAAGTDAGAATPVGALSKTGQLPPGVGGEITGTVRAASDEQPVGRILVEAYRHGRSGLLKVSSAATQTDGTYTLAGLFPTSYVLQFTSPGFKPVWYPNVPTQQGAKSVNATAEGSTTGINAVIQGLPATISGSIDPGDTTKQVSTVVTARPLNTVGGSASVKKVTTNGGKYTITGLKAPASYQLTFTTPGYQASSLVDAVDGGDKRIEAAVTLSSAQGGISGIVVNGNKPNDPPIGGATVSTTVAGKTLSVLTPTTGAVGTFALGNLPTPATYVLTYSAPGHGTWTEVVALDAGQSKTTAIGKLTTGTGSVSGRVLDASNHGLGGVTVTVGGAAIGGTSIGGTVQPGATTAPTTTTLTSPPVGKFYLNGLTDGTYTLTFSLDGYGSATVTMTVDSTKKAPTVVVRLSKEAGTIEGTITHNGLAFPGASVTATDGLTTFTATSSAAGGDLSPGGYLISGLKPGTYTVTASVAGLIQQTRIVVVAAGATVRGQDLALGG